MTDLEKLIEAVEAGRWWGDSGVCAEAVHRAGFKRPDAKVMTSAFNGSLDAAKALHEALLPGWVIRLTHRDASVPHVHVFKMRVVEEDPPQGANSAGFKGHDPARAWLLALLRAYATRDAA